MSRKSTRKAAKPRNPMARTVRKMGLKVVPSAKTYKRRPKHKSARDTSSEDN